MSHANTLSILLVLATVVVGIQGTPNLDPCLDDRSPQSCYGVICFHGNCHSAFAIKDGHIVLVGRCTCINGWHGLCHNVTRDDTEAYICDCDEGWTGIHCDTCCDISCNQGSCHVDYDTKEMYCICHNNSYLSSSNCSEMIIDLPSQNGLRHNWSWAVVGVVLFLATCLVIIVVLLPYTMWKKRHHLMMKIVYLFQKYDDSGIAENIIRAVENSSRTILVLSPDYCHGGWPRFEVQAAQKEMMNLRHRIVPIMFKDISQIRVADRVDKLLEYLLNTVTYIQWPGTEGEQAERRFWGQLRLAMPKVREGYGIPTIET
ncbi:hypothetical protein LSH36_256g06060 [Paralvinella palmiformis]|uniref:TIR domain-containing protein n=1 Tax=Paralvinella palmiformis TaxID=53620 RepID=A0AAD9JLB0_9ANNE|nr:hypothetical protein LSH36_256g06060 [Paralvinella palmiformis]